MSNYPAIVPGLRVRHRETLEERTVTKIGVDIVTMDEVIWSYKYNFWDRYEPLPQPGDRARVVRAALCARADSHLGLEGELKTYNNEFFVSTNPGTLHQGPLSDFEVILPEESETNMTNNEMNMINNETVAVPVELIDRAYEQSGDEISESLGRIYDLAHPKPKLRLRFIDLDEFLANQPGAGLAEYIRNIIAQPDLRDTLDDVIDEWARFRSYLRKGDAESLKGHLRIDLGVSE